MKITEWQKDWITVIELKGNIMGGPEEDSLYDKLQELIALGRKKVVIDLSKTEWMNSRGLGILISGLTTMRNNSGELKIAALTQKVRSIMVMTRLITAFDNYEMVEEAIGSFKYLLLRVAKFLSWAFQFLQPGFGIFNIRYTRISLTSYFKIPLILDYCLIWLP
jgi:anti-sigma B factor antagonist